MLEPVTKKLCSSLLELLGNVEIRIKAKKRKIDCSGFLPTLGSVSKVKFLGNLLLDLASVMYFHVFGNQNLDPKIHLLKTGTILILSNILKKCYDLLQGRVSPQEVHPKVYSCACACFCNME